MSSLSTPIFFCHGLYLSLHFIPLWFLILLNLIHQLTSCDPFFLNIFSTHAKIINVIIDGSKSHHDTSFAILSLDTSSNNDDAHPVSLWPSYLLFEGKASRVTWKWLFFFKIDMKFSVHMCLYLEHKISKFYYDMIFRLGEKKRNGKKKHSYPS